MCTVDLDLCGHEDVSSVGGRTDAGISWFISEILERGPRKPTKRAFLFFARVGLRVSELLCYIKPVFQEIPHSPQRVDLQTIVDTRTLASE
jgi:hypothetical protein